MGLFGNQPGKSEREKAYHPFPEGYLPSIQYQTAQSVGLTRDHNEDALSAFSATILTCDASFTFGLFIVADGMGGHLNGEVASNLAVQNTNASLMRMVFDPMRLGQKKMSDTEVNEALEKAVFGAHDAVLKQVSGGGTTLTVALVLNQILYAAHVGDSRLYLASPHTSFAPLTTDHSVVQRLTELGQITEKEAREHPSRNVLFRAIGQQEGFKIDLLQRPLKEHTQLLLCSDGLWGLVRERKLAGMLNSTSRDIFAAQKLVDLANAEGGTDNISVIMVTID
ncbi:MAG: protein phosphatase 2C domain-containing protein [Anaerolineaceae bacterium]